MEWQELVQRLYFTLTPHDLKRSKPRSKAFEVLALKTAVALQHTQFRRRTNRAKTCRFSLLVLVLSVVGMIFFFINTSLNQRKGNDAQIEYRIIKNIYHRLIIIMPSHAFHMPPLRLRSCDRFDYILPPLLCPPHSPCPYSQQLVCVCADACQQTCQLLLNVPKYQGQ